MVRYSGRISNGDGSRLHASEGTAINACDGQWLLQNGTRTEIMVRNFRAWQARRSYKGRDAASVIFFPEARSSTISMPFSRRTSSTRVIPSGLFASNRRKRSEEHTSELQSP